uniref:Bifunctional protein HldE n=1 Tax=uncultured beta proteobacterium HF0130_04F21 TaxID=710819 RepID=E0XSU4_9PROT|nr:ADP-heptose synthase, bifunctional sugar kinase/adenylyltransferase [uncultured beta proteobacterium HF0130_04F21]
MKKAFDTSARVLIVGDVMKDMYVFGSTDRISPEAPVPIVRVKKFNSRAGGAANVATNLSSLGIQTTLLSVVGSDSISKEIESLLVEKRVKCVFLKDKKLETIQKHRIISQNQQIIRIDFESEFPMSKFENKHYHQLRANFENELSTTVFDAIIFSDYKKGVLQFCHELVSIAQKFKIPIFIDPKGDDFSKYMGAYLVKPNLKEFENVVGSTSSEHDFNLKAEELRNFLKLENLLITRGKEGMTLFRKEKSPLTVKANDSKEVYDVTGAGDTVLAIIVAASVSKLSIKVAMEIANYGASIVIGKFGTACISIDEIQPFLTSKEDQNSETNLSNSLKNKMEIEYLKKGKHLSNRKDLTLVIKDLRESKKKVVFTNGCFDILHSGHVYLLEEARKHGDCLIVAVNGDKSVKRLKGKDRPINSLMHRIKVLRALECVDFITIFDEDTPEKVIKFLKPDVLIKGSDYRLKEVVGADIVKKNGGKVELVLIQENLSTTLISKKLDY